MLQVQHEQKKWTADGFIGVKGNQQLPAIT
jgi:hypothetical protein